MRDVVRDKIINPAFECQMNHRLIVRVREHRPPADPQVPLLSPPAHVVQQLLNLYVVQRGWSNGLGFNVEKDVNESIALSKRPAILSSMLRKEQILHALRLWIRFLAP